MNTLTLTPPSGRANESNFSSTNNLNKFNYGNK